MAGNSGNAGSHQQTYDGFMRMVKIGTGITVVIAAFVVWLIA